MSYRFFLVGKDKVDRANAQAAKSMEIDDDIIVEAYQRASDLARQSKKICNSAESEACRWNSYWVMVEDVNIVATFCSTQA